MKYLKNILLLSVFNCMMLQSNAWGLLGHRIIGEIADSYLSPHTKKEIQKILGTETIAMSSNWADFIRSDPNYGYLTPWHYVDLEAGLDSLQFRNHFAADTATDAYTKINFLVNELKNKRAGLSPEMRTMYLKLLIHIVGDVHQPLHVGHREDKGGNSIQVKWFGSNSNLHRVWDESLIGYQQLSYTEYAAAINHTTKEQREEWQKQPIVQWLWDSYQLANKLYADIEPEQKLSYEYNFKYIALLNERLLEGGVHLAGVLNDIFG